MQWDSWSEPANAPLAAARVEIRKGPAAPDPRFGALPRWKCPDFMAYRFLFALPVEKPIEQQTKVHHRRSPQRSGKGGYRRAAPCRFPPGLTGSLHPVPPRKSASLCRHRNGVFRGEAPELIFAYFCSGTKVGRPEAKLPKSPFAEPAARCFGAQPSAARLLARRCLLFFREKSRPPEA